MSVWKDTLKKSQSRKLAAIYLQTPWNLSKYLYNIFFLFSYFNHINHIIFLIIWSYWFFFLIHNFFLLLENFSGLYRVTKDIIKKKIIFFFGAKKIVFMPYKICIFYLFANILFALFCLYWKTVGDSIWGFFNFILFFCVVWKMSRKNCWIMKFYLLLGFGGFLQCPFNLILCCRIKN